MSRIACALGLACLLLPAVLAAEEPDVQTSAGPAPAATTVAPAPQTALEKTVAAIHDAAAAQIEKLAVQPAADPSEAEAIQKQIEQIKFDAEVSIVRAVIADATERGDVTQRVEAEGALDHLLHPEKYAAASAPANRPAPKTN